MIWIVLVMKDIQEWGDYGVSKAMLPCVLGVTALVAPILIIPLFGLHGLTLVLTLAISVFVYLLSGIGLFFALPITNATIRWTDNGAW